MPHYIKTGYWALEKNGYKGWLNLEDIIGGGGSSPAVSVTKAEVDALITANSLVPGQTYIISGVDVPLYGGTTVILQADTTNKLALAGHGIFYNPKYLNSQLTPNNGYGIWSNYMNNVIFDGVSGVFIGFGQGAFTLDNCEVVTADNGATAIYVSQGFLIWLSGDWSTATSIVGFNSGATANVSGGVSPSYAIGQNVIWGGKHWVNISGNVGTSVDKYTLSATDWTEVPFNSIDYNVVADVIHYDYEHDMIIRRKDKWNNDVDGNYEVFYVSLDYGYGNPIKDFQWGNGSEDFDFSENIGVQSNYIKDSYFDCINFIGQQCSYNTLTQNTYFSKNIIDQYSIIQSNVFTGLNAYGDVFYSGVIDCLFVKSEFSGNILNSGSYIYGISSNQSKIVYNYLYEYGTIYNIVAWGSTIYGNELENAYLGESNLLGSLGGMAFGSPFIYGNKLFESSMISNIIINNVGSISGNELYESFISNNTINNSSKIEKNTLHNGAISFNLLSSTSAIISNILHAGEVSFITNATINNNTLSSSEIVGNTLMNVSSLNNNLLDTSYIRFNELNNSAFDFSTSGTLTGKTISNIESSYANATFNVSAATIIYGDYSKQMFRNSAGTTRLGYYNASDVFTVVNVNA